MRIILICSLVMASWGVLASSDLAKNEDFHKLVKLITAGNTKKSYVRLQPEEGSYSDFCDHYNYFGENFCETLCDSVDVVGAGNYFLQKISKGSPEITKSLFAVLGQEKSFKVCEDGTMTDSGRLDDFIFYGDSGKIAFSLTLIDLFIHE